MALTTLDKLNDWLAGDASDFSDEQKNAAISYVNTLIESFTGRTFDIATYIQWVDGSGTNKQVVENYPFIAMYRVACKSKITGYISNSSSLPYTINITHAAKMILTIAGQTPEEIDLTAHSTLTSLKGAIDAIGTWSMTVQTEDVPSHLKPMIKNGVNGTNLSIYSPDDDNSIIVNAISPSILGSNCGFPYGFANIFLNYQAGYSTIPGDLEGAATQMSGDVVRSSPVDKNYDSEKIGKYSYKLSKQGEAALIAPYLTIINLYKDV